MIHIITVLRSRMILNGLLKSWRNQLVPVHARHAVSLLTTGTIKFRTTLVPCSLGASLLDQMTLEVSVLDQRVVGNQRNSVLEITLTVRDLTNQEQAFINRTQTCPWGGHSNTFMCCHPQASEYRSTPKHRYLEYKIMMTPYHRYSFTDLP